MAGFNVVSNVRRLFPDVTAAVEQYRQAKSDRDSKNLARRLANEEALYDQFMRKLSLLSSLKTIEGDEDVLQSAESRLGCKSIDSLRVDLHHMEDFLRALKSELANASRGTEVLVKLRKTASSRGNIPRLPFQKRIDELSKVNKRVAAYLQNEHIPLLVSVDFQTTLDFRVSLQQHPDKTAKAFRVAGGRYACTCTESVLSNFKSTSLSDGTARDAIGPLETGMSRQEISKHAYVSVHKFHKTSHASESLPDIYSHASGIDKQQGGSHRDTIKKEIHLSIREARAPQDAISLEELNARDINFAWAKRMELAFRLGAAVILLWKSPSIRNSMKWKDWTVFLTAKQESETYGLSIGPKIRSDEELFERPPNSDKVFSILARDTVLALLGLRLVELAFGQTLEGIRQQDAHLPHGEERDQDLLDLLTAKRLLGLGRIGEECGSNFESVINACLTQQYREGNDGHIRYLSFEDDSFLESATVTILLPLFKEFRKSSGCDCHGVYPGEAEGLEMNDKIMKSVANQDIKLASDHTFNEGIQMLDETVTETAFQVVSRPARTDSVSNLPMDDVSNEDNQHSHPSTEKDQMDVQAENISLPKGSLTQSVKKIEEGVEDSRRTRNIGIPERESSTQNLLSVEPDAGTDSDYSYETMTATTDSAFAWLSDNTDTNPSISEKHPLLAFKDVSFRILWNGFQAWRQYGYGADEVSGSFNQKEPSKKRGRHQQKNDDEDDDIDEESSSRNPRNSNKKQRTKAETLTFSCPFFKKSPTSHQHCCTYTLTRIRDVKQHLARRHQMPIYCPRCIRTFNDENARDSHVREIDCERRPYARLEGITEAQKKQLGKKAPLNQTPEQQWYGIFDILFPDHYPKPESPYIDSGLLQDVMGYQSYLESDGPRILSEILTASGAVTWNLPSIDTDIVAFQHRILEEGIQRIFDEWTRHGIPTTNATRGSTNEINVQTTSGPSVTPAISFDEEYGSPEPQPSSTFASSSYVPSDMSWDGEGGWLAELHLDEHGVGDINPVTLGDKEEIENIFNTNPHVQNHVRYR